MEYLLVIVGGYLLGSIPFGLLLTKAFGYGDIRDIGSGNIGATNVLRTGNKKLALATLVLDGLKGALAVGLTVYITSHSLPWCAILNCVGVCKCYNYTQNPHYLPLIAGLFAIIGHLFPVWLKFRGGKGVATTLGTLLAVKPFAGLIACALWLIVALVTRYSSLSALVAIGATPAIAHFLYHDANVTGVFGIIATLVFIKHRANIRRMITGEEPKIGRKK